MVLCHFLYNSFHLVPELCNIDNIEASSRVWRSTFLLQRACGMHPCDRLVLVRTYLVCHFSTERYISVYWKRKYWPCYDCNLRSIATFVLACSRSHIYTQMRWRLVLLHRILHAPILSIFWFAEVGGEGGMDCVICNSYAFFSLCNAPLLRPFYPRFSGSRKWLIVIVCVSFNYVLFSEKITPLIRKLFPALFTYASQTRLFRGQLLYYPTPYWWKHFECVLY